MTISFRADSGVKISVNIEDMSIEQLAQYMDHIENTLYIPVDTSRMYKKDRRIKYN